MSRSSDNVLPSRLLASISSNGRRWTAMPFKRRRDAAVAAIDHAMVLGGGPSPREKDLEQQNVELRSALAQAMVERSIAMKGVEEWKRASRPSRPARSRR